MKARDSQRERVYRAARALPEYDIQALPWADVEAFVARVNDSTWFRSRWHIRITAVLKRGGSGYGYSDGTITLPLFCRVPLIILHEIAHCVTRGADHPDCAAHGPEFCATYVALVRHFMGADVAARLRASMREQRVKVAAASTVPAARYTARPAAEIRTARTAAARRPLSRTQLAEVASLTAPTPTPALSAPVLEVVRLVAEADRNGVPVIRSYRTSRDPISSHPTAWTVAGGPTNAAARRGLLTVDDERYVTLTAAGRVAAQPSCQAKAPAEYHPHRPRAADAPPAEAHAGQGAARRDPMSDFLTELRKVADGEPSISEHGTHREVTAKVLGLVTFYVLDRDGTVLGRGEFAGSAARANFYAGGRIKGGRWIGSGLSNEQFLRVINDGVLR